MKREGSFCLQKICLFVGMLAGMLLINMMWKEEAPEKEIWICKWMIELFQKEHSVYVYIEKMLLLRSGILLLFLLILKSGRGSFFCLLFLGVEAVKIGATITLSILQLGFLGGIWGVALLFPHYLLYVYVYMLMAEGFCMNVRRSIKTRRFLCLKKTKDQKMSLYISLLYVMGVVMETILNPIFLKELAKIIKIS